MVFFVQMLFLLHLYAQYLIMLFLWRVYIYIFNQIYTDHSKKDTVGIVKD